MSWDGNGNLTAITDNVGSVESFSNASRSMVYDGLDRLTIANSAPQPQLRTSTPWAYSWGEASFSYDGLDNIRTFNMAAVDFTYAYDANGRLQSVSQAWVPTPVASYTHNARGQMTGRQFGGQQFTLNWDSAHRVTQTWNAASSVVESYRYDAHGHRVRTVRGGETVYQVYTQAGDLLWETSSNGATRKYARLGGRLIGESVNGGRYAIHTDVIGSVRQKTDVLGTLVYEDVRAPYGSTLLGGEYQNGPAFTGHMEDGATGLTYMKARYYHPVAMRFISPDPVYVDLVTGGNFNRYWYANNNPYTYVDPDGRDVRIAIPLVVGGIVGWCGTRGATACQQAAARTAATVRALYFGGRLLTEAQDPPSGVQEQGEEESGIPPSAGYGENQQSGEGNQPDQKNGREPRDRTSHGEERAQQGRHDPHRQVGDSNRGIREGRQFRDTETGNTIYVKGNRVVVVRPDGKHTQFTNPRANTGTRIRSGKWEPMN